MEVQEIMPNDPRYESQGIGLYRKWFREAVDRSKKWHEQARQDYDFVEGRQWSESEIKAFHDSGRPAIVINRIRPLVNLLSGYQRVNRLDIEFLGRTPDDSESAQIRKGITKYILDSCDFEKEESAVFLDSIIGGLGWFFVGYELNEDGTDGEAYVRRENPFGIFVDPESHSADFSDAKYICRAKWVDKEELKEVYPEHAEAIDAQYSIYDSYESEVAPKIDELLWYKRELQKVRIVECWYKTRERQVTIILANGEEIPVEELTPEIFISGMVVGTNEKIVPVVKVCVFFDEIILEEMPSPYQHGELPLVPLTCYYYGVDNEIPAGFVRDLKSPQKEINKRRIIPQFYNTEKVYRIEGINGQQFVTVNQQVIEQDPIAGTVVKTLNDLSQGEFDIVISDVEASVTQRQAQLWTLIDGISKLGIPGDIAFDVVLDLSDIPSKEEIKQRWKQRQESQANAAKEQLQMQIQLEEIKNRDFRQTIAFKDAPFAIQIAMAAKAGYINPQIADYFIMAMVKQLAPELAAQLQQPELPPELEQMQPQENQMTPEQLDQAIALSQMMNGQANNQGGALTQAATESLMRGMTPAI